VSFTARACKRPAQQLWGAVLCAMCLQYSQSFPEASARHWRAASTGSCRGSRACRHDGTGSGVPTRNGVHHSLKANVRRGATLTTCPFRSPPRWVRVSGLTAAAGTLSNRMRCSPRLLPLALYHPQHLLHICMLAWLVAAAHCHSSGLGDCCALRSVSWHRAPEGRAATYRLVRHKEIWPAAMKPGDVVLTVEHCSDCAIHGYTTRHDESKYETYASMVRAAHKRRFPHLQIERATNCD
jgi:hypothetical protein